MSGVDLVTGGRGFLGRHLVELLVSQGRNVRVLDLRPWPEAPASVEAISGSITDPGIVERAMAGCERVFHLAANPNLWAPDPSTFEIVNHQGTRRVLEAAMRQKPGRIVYTSTESILKSYRAPKASRSALIDETVKLSVDDMPGPYCRSKFHAEEAAKEAAAAGLPVVIVNPTMPIGPGDELMTPPTKMLLGFVNGKTPAYLDCEFNLVDARDAALGHLLAAEHGRIGERYILGAVNIRLADLLAELETITGLGMTKRKVPYGLALVSAFISEGIATITRKPPIAPITGVRLARTSMAFDCSKARRDLKWQCRPLRETLVDTLAWLSACDLLRRPIR